MGEEPYFAPAEHTVERKAPSCRDLDRARSRVNTPRSIGMVEIAFIVPAVATNLLA